MMIDSLSTYDIAGLVAGLFLTLSIFSYIFGDNTLFRLAIHIFIGVAAGFVSLIILHNFIWPKIIIPLRNLPGAPAEAVLTLVPLILSFLLLTKLVPGLRSIGSPVMAYLVGVGAAIAVGGAVIGTLLPQVMATIDLFEIQPGTGPLDSSWQIMLDSTLILIGTLTTLIYFHFGAKPDHNGTMVRTAWIETIAKLGKVFIMVTFGAIFASVLLASLTAFSERVNFLMSIFSS